MQSTRMPHTGCCSRGLCYPGTSGFTWGRLYKSATELSRTVETEEKRDFVWKCMDACKKGCPFKGRKKIPHQRQQQYDVPTILAFESQTFPEIKKKKLNKETKTKKRFHFLRVYPQ